MAIFAFKAKMMSKKNLTYILILIISITFFGCSDKKNKDSNNSTDTEESLLPQMKPSNVKYAKLSKSYIQSKKIPIENYCNKYFREGNSNLSFLVAKNGQIIYERYQGYANKNKNTKITKETSIHIASVSKVLTATAILLLIDRKDIDLDQKVNTILDNFPYPEITIKTLLDHRSGLRNYAYFIEDKGVWDLKKTITNQDILNLFTEKNIQLESPTNTRFSYCNTNYAMLALVIEKITGLKYGEAMNEMIFKPLKMTHTFVFDFQKGQKPDVPSYKGNNMELAIDHLDAVYGDKNIFSTPRDLLKFDLARNSPDFLSKKLRAKIFTGYSNEHKGTKNYGLGIRMVEWETGQKFYFHNGWWHGYTSSYITLQKEHVVIIAISNKFTKNTYTFRKLAPLFGDYPFKFEDE